MSLRVQAHGEGLAWSDRVRPAVRFDLVLVGQLLSELDLDLPDAERVERHAALLARSIEHHLEEHGSLVVIEPALRDRTRHLHRVRDAVLRLPDRTAGVSKVTVFAPCLHDAPCPALARDTDWCHEDLPVDVPSWLVPVAQAAGLRREGLTFSYLVLRRDGARLVDALPTGPARRARARLRVVSGAMPSKGKHEAFVCGELESEGALVPGRARLMRLDRDARAPNASWADAARGGLLVVAPAPKLERPRIDSGTIVEPIEAVEPVCDETR